MRPEQINQDDLRLGAFGGTAFRAGGAVAVGGILISVVVGFFAGWDQFMRAYVLGFMLVLSLSLGGLFFTGIQHATRAGWSVAIRRLAEAMMANLLWIWVLFIPIALLVITGNAGDLYHWTHGELYVPGSAEYDSVLTHKAPYFFFTRATEGGHPIPWFWLLRAAVYFGLWALIARHFFRHSVAQDTDGDVEHTHRMQFWAPLAMLAYALTQTYAAIDWMMSLEAHWFSTMFGVYFFAASCCGSFAMLVLIMFTVQRSGAARREITAEHYQDAGKLLFAFGIVFWAYIAFSQYMLIWYGNLPEETTWFLVRQLGGWKAISIFLLVGHFIAPFLFLISKHPKRRMQVIAGAAAWMLLMHCVDLYLIIKPILPMEQIASAASYAELQQSVTAADLNFSPPFMDLAMILGMLGLWIAMTARRLSGCNLIPSRDPRLAESLAFENM